MPHQCLPFLQRQIVFAKEKCFANADEALPPEMNCGPTRLAVTPVCAPADHAPRIRNRTPLYIATLRHKTDPGDLSGKPHPNIASDPELLAPKPHHNGLVDGAYSRKFQKHGAPAPGNANVVQDRDWPWRRYQSQLVRQENSCIAPFPMPLVPATTDTGWRIARSKALLLEQGIPSPATGCGLHIPLETAQIIFR